MPYKSKKQRAWMHINKPKIAKRWDKKYDGKVVDRIKRLEREVERLRVKEKQVFVPLTTPLTSTSWNGDSFSTTGKTLIDLSTEFGVPPGIKAVYLKVAVRDSGSAGAACLVQFSGNPVGTNYVVTVPASEVSDRYAYASAIVPCNPDGDIYYQISASGSATMDVYAEVWGYWL